MDDIFFTWYTLGVKQKIIVDVYEVVRPSLVCEGKMLIRHHTRFKRKINDDDGYKIKIVKYPKQYFTGTYIRDNRFSIPNNSGGRYRSIYLFNLYDIRTSSSGDAVNSDNYITMYKPMVKFIEYMLDVDL